MLDPLDVVPSRQNPSTFSDDMDGFLNWLLTVYVPWANSIENSFQFTATNGTSTTSLAITTGSKSLTTQINKAWAVGSYVYLVNSSDVSKLMVGQVTAYNNSTGALTVNVTTTMGSGTYATWSIGLAVPDVAAANLSGGAAGAIPYQTSPGVTAMLAAGAANRVLQANGAAPPSWVSPDAMVAGADAAGANNFPRLSQAQTLIANAVATVAVGGFRALSVSATGTNANVSVSADAVVLLNGSGGAYMAAPSLTINSAASGANGLDTGSLATSTWYSVWVISNGTTTAGLISLSTFSPTMPSGYTYKARVGWIRTDATGNKFPLSFAQFGRSGKWVVTAGSNVPAGRVLISGTQGNVLEPIYVSASVGAFVPPTAGIVEMFLLTTGTQVSAAAPSNAFGRFDSITNPPPLAAGMQSTTTSASGQFALEGAYPQSVYYAAGSTNSALIATGWEDNL